MSGKVKYYNSDSLKLIRDYYGESQSAFAKRINTTQPKLSKLENGELELTEEYTSILEDFTAIFFNNNFNAPAQKLFYRKLASTSKSMVSKFEARLTLLSGIISYLLKRVIIPENNLPLIDVEKFSFDFENIAKDVRTKLNCPYGPIEDIVTLLESNGVLIHFFEYNFITESNRKFDGVSTYVDGTPVILINNKIPNSRKVFTIAHELGHLVMHFNHIIGESRDIEDEANKFASAFLAPEGMVKTDFIGFNLEKLFHLKTKWRMSAAAILYRAREIGNIKPDWHKKCMMSLSKYRRKEPFEFDIKEPTLLNKVIKAAKKDKDLKFSFTQEIGIGNNIVNELFNNEENEVVNQKRIKVSL